MDKQKYRMMVEEQIENEKKVATLLRGLMRETNNTVVRLLLHGLALDSIKHENMLMAILQLLEPSSKNFEREDKEFREVIKKHVEIERKMLEDFERIVDKTEDNRVKFILQEIIRDEKRHHVVAKRVHELLYESEKVQDEKWWDFLFRYSHLSG